MRFLARTRAGDVAATNRIYWSQEAAEAYADRVRAAGGTPTIHQSKTWWMPTEDAA